MDERFAVLIVDDDPDIRETLREIIAAEGYPVMAAPNGRAAMEALRGEQKPALIVLDLMMPGMNGWEVLAALRADRVLAEIPVAVVSAAGGKTPPAGATHFLRKPIELDTLLELLRNPQPHPARRPGRVPSTVEPRSGLQADSEVVPRWSQVNGAI